MNIILTGASSFLGKAAAKTLLARGHELVLLRHSFEEAEIALPAHADVWIHFAWAGVGSKGRQDEAVQAFNVAMSMAALQKAAQLGCSKFLFAGSQAEYGHANRQEETEACAPISAYGKAKLLFSQKARNWLLKEQAGKEQDALMQFVHMRIFSVYGPGDHETALVPSCLRAFCKGADMDFGPCTQDWDYLYLTDAADAVALLAEADIPGLSYRCVNIAGTDIRPLKSYIEEMHALCKSASKMHFGARGNNAEGAVSLRPVTKRLAALGFKAQTKFADGIQKMLLESDKKA